MQRGTRYAIMAIMAIITIIVLVLIFNVVRSVFDGDDSPDQAQDDRDRPVNLIAAAGSGQPVRYTIRGAVVGDETRRSIRITIDSDSRELEILQGYSDQVERREVFYNTQDAYKAFAAALNGAGFSLSIDPEGRGIEDQVCPIGRHYVYEVAHNSEDDFRTWSTSCLKTHGTFGGNSETVRQLFQRQIPNYNRLTDNVQLNS